MTDVVQVYDYRFLTTDWPIMRLQVRVSEIAQSLGLEIERWEEDGWGPAHGMLLRLPSGRVFLFRELQHGIDHFDEKGPHVCVDATVVAEFGVDYLIDEVLTSLGLSEQDVDWRGPHEAQASAMDLAKWAAACRTQKE